MSVRDVPFLRPTCRLKVLGSVRAAKIAGKKSLYVCLLGCLETFFGNEGWRLQISRLNERVFQAGKQEVSGKRPL